MRAYTLRASSVALYALDLFVEYIGDEHVTRGVRDADIGLRAHDGRLRCHTARPENGHFILFDSYRLAKIGLSQILNADLLRIANMHRSSVD